MWDDIVQRLKAAEQRMIVIRRERIGIGDDAARVITESVRKIWRQLHLAKTDRREKEEER